MEAEKILEVGGLAASIYGLYQSKNLHEKEKKLCERRHHESVKIAEEQHRKELRVAKQTYLMAVFASLEQHFQQLNADLISSSKESENDMFDQRNQSFQTVILSSSVMFSSLSTVIIQGILPSNSSVFLFVAYAVTCSLSFAFLFLCIVLCIEIILRASSFMYNRAKNHTDNLKNAIAETKIMMESIRGNHRNEEEEDGEEEKKDELNYGAHNYKGPEDQSKFRRKIAGMSEEALEKEWKKHEQEVHEYLDKREKINEKCFILAAGSGNANRGMSFEEFWSQSCKYWADLAITFFYVGTANLLLAIMIFMWAEFLLVYFSPEGAVVSVILIGLSLLAGILLATMLRRQDKKSKLDQAKEEQAEGHDHNRQLIGISMDERDEEAGLGRVGPSVIVDAAVSPRSRSGSLFSRFSPRAQASPAVASVTTSRQPFGGARTGSVIGTPTNSTMPRAGAGVGSRAGAGAAVGGGGVVVGGSQRNSEQPSSSSSRSYLSGTSLSSRAEGPSMSPARFRMAIPRDDSDSESSD